jgi:hypothetical protein
MTAIRIALIGLAGALLLALPATAGTTATRLTATVGPNFTISLKKGTTRVTRIPRGTYTIVVRDRSSLHNFHLRGPGSINKRTGVAFVGTRTWTVRLRAGRYTYVCDPHATTMRGTFRVTGIG